MPWVVIAPSGQARGRLALEKFIDDRLSRDRLLSAFRRKPSKAKTREKDGFPEQFRSKKASHLPGRPG
jgi:hypothetical protein